MYQKMVDKGFSITSIAFIFSVSEESIEKRKYMHDLDMQFVWMISFRL